MTEDSCWGVVLRDGLPHFTASARRVQSNTRGTLSIGCKAGVQVMGYAASLHSLFVTHDADPAAAIGSLKGGLQIASSCVPWNTAFDERSLHTGVV